MHGKSFLGTIVNPEVYLWVHSSNHEQMSCQSYRPINGWQSSLDTVSNQSLVSDPAEGGRFLLGQTGRNTEGEGAPPLASSLARSRHTFLFNKHPCSGGPANKSLPLFSQRAFLLFLDVPRGAHETRQARVAAPARARRGAPLEM